MNADMAAVAFDMDGILIDSEPLIRMAAQQAATALGYTVSDELYMMWMGLPPRAVEDAVAESMGPGFPMQDYREQMMHIWTEHTTRHGVPAQPGIADLLAALTERGIPFSVATSTRRAQAERSLELAGLSRWIEVIVAGDEVENGKPAPEIFLRAAERLGVAPTACVALEDSAVGIRAAAGADMLTIMVPDLHQPSAEVVALADYVLPSTNHAARVVLKLFEQPRA